MSTATEVLLRVNVAPRRNGAHQPIPTGIWTVIDSLSGGPLTRPIPSDKGAGMTSNKNSPVINIINGASIGGILLVLMSAYSIWHIYRSGLSDIADLTYPIVVVVAVAGLVVGLFLRNRAAATMLLLYYVGTNIYNLSAGFLQPHQLAIPVIFAVWIFSGVAATYRYHNTMPQNDLSNKEAS